MAWKDKIVGIAKITKCTVHNIFYFAGMMLPELPEHIQVAHHQASVQYKDRGSFWRRIAANALPLLERFSVGAFAKQPEKPCDQITQPGIEPIAVFTEQ